MSLRARKEEERESREDDFSISFVNKRGTRATLFILGQRVQGRGGEGILAGANGAGGCLILGGEKQSSTSEVTVV